MSDKLEKLKEWLANINSVVIKKQWIVDEIDRLQSEEEFCEWRHDDYLDPAKRVALFQTSCNIKPYAIKIAGCVRCYYCGLKIKEV